MTLSTTPYSEVSVCTKKTAHPTILGLGVLWNPSLEERELGFSSGSAEGHQVKLLTPGLRSPARVRHTGQTRGFRWAVSWCHLED